MTDTYSLTQRPALSGDESFLFDVYASTRAEELAPVPWDDAQKEAFLRMQFHAQHTDYHARFPNAQYDILLRDGEPIGRLYTDRRAGEIRILDIALLPQSRGLGIGASLLKSLMAEAAAAGLPVRLQVETFNRARRLYERLGFTQVQNNGIYLLMQWVTPCSTQ